MSTLACSFHIDIPVNTITPGPMITDKIEIPVSEYSHPTHLSLAFGAGELKVHPGTGKLISGTATYNVIDLKPSITINSSDIHIEQGNWHLNDIPDLSNFKNIWDISLGSFPIDLSVEAGAYQAEYELGGLAITNLTIKDGASHSMVNFASPILAEMSLLNYQTGASNASLTGLANANFSSLNFHSGAGNYTLDFSGNLKPSGSVSIETGISNTTLVIPRGIPVQLTMEEGLSNITHDSSWSQNGNVYTQEGNGPQLNIVVRIVAGNLTLTR